MKFGDRGLKVGVGVSVLVLGIGGGCDRDAAPQEEVELSAPAQPEEADLVAEPSEPEVEQVQPEGPPAGPMHFASWPGREELHTFDLMWLGGDRQLELRAEPDPEAEVVSRAGWMDTEEIVWADTRVRVMEPALFEVVGEREVVGLAYDEAFEELDAEEVRLRLEDGELLALYQYGGEGTCYVGARGQVLLGECPVEDGGLKAVQDAQPGEATSGETHPELKERWRPRQQEWWVKVRQNAASGWMRVDDAPIEVHVRLIEGYD